MPKARHNPLPAFLIMIQVIIIDQLTKLWVLLSFDLGESVTILPQIFGETFRLTHVRNTGAAFSFSPMSPEMNRYLFTGIAFLAVAFIIYLLLHNTHRIQVFAFGLVMGGALGNAIDRILIGGVTDFMDVNLPRFISAHRFPIFNVADSMIFIAMMLLMYEILFIKEATAIKTPIQEIRDAVDLEAKN